MSEIVTYVILIATFISALGTILNNVRGFSKGTKKSVDAYILKQITPSFEAIEKSIDNVNNELNRFKAEYDADKVQNDKDKMQRLRYKCLVFASDIRKGEAKTRQEYEEIFRMESEYEDLIEKYHIKNGYMEEEMLYVHNQYRALIK